MAQTKHRPASLSLVRKVLVGMGVVLLNVPIERAATNDAPIAATRSGPVRGVDEAGIKVFKGIPYAGTTGGARRFLPPVAPLSWTRVRDAGSFGDRCPQLTPPPTPAWESWTEPQKASEDCLVLNVWTPGLRDGRRRPVMLWLHGGGFTLFSGASSVYDGQRLAARGDVVVVTLNHRLNVFGYLYLSDILGPDYADSGNVGQLDIIAALKWVHDNIEEFGGDPDSVTIFGESGGGGKVGTLMAMPAAQGLFHRAIMQSGFAITAITADAAAKMTSSLLAALKLRSDEAAKLKTLPVARLLGALQEVTHGLPFGWGPVVDGRSLPKHPFSPEAPKISARIPLIVGSNKDETTVLFPPAGAFDLDWPGLESQLKSTMPAAKVEALIAGFRRLRPEATPSDIFFTVTTELSMGANANAVAERKAALQAAPVYQYRLEWMTPVESGRLRTPHALDLPMIFDNVAKSDSLIGEGTSQAQQVANAMSAAWIAFARTGSPNAPGLASWPPFDAQNRSTMVFNTVSRAVNDPLRAERLLLEPVALAPASP